MGPIGIFDSGYGGLTILHGIRQLLPEYDYLYLGDNARAPYGSRSFDVVYQFTRQAVMKLFSMGCQLVILGCNTASAKALRSIQQNDLPEWNSPDSPLFAPTEAPRRVLGVIRPTAEVIGTLTESRHVGLLATEGTVRSESYKLEINKLFPGISVTGVACPLWVPIIAHALNNSVVVVATYLANTHAINTHALNNIGLPQDGQFPFMALVSAIVTALIIYYFVKTRKCGKVDKDIQYISTPEE